MACLKQDEGGKSRRDETLSLNQVEIISTWFICQDPVNRNIETKLFRFDEVSIKDGKLFPCFSCIPIGLPFRVWREVYMCIKAEWGISMPHFGASFFSHPSSDRYKRNEIISLLFLHLLRSRLQSLKVTLYAYTGWAIEQEQGEIISLWLQVSTIWQLEFPCANKTGSHTGVPFLRYPYFIFHKGMGVGMGKQFFLGEKVKLFSTHTVFQNSITLLHFSLFRKLTFRFEPTETVSIHRHCVLIFYYIITHWIKGAAITPFSVSTILSQAPESSRIKKLPKNLSMHHIQNWSSHN